LEKSVAVIVNGQFVEDERFIEAFRQLGGFEIDTTSPGGRSQANALRRLSERQVAGQIALLQKALGAGFTVSAEEVSARRSRLSGMSSASVCGAAVYRQLADELLVERYSMWLSRHEPHPSRAETEQYYELHRAEFWLPERVQATHIVCNAELPGDEDGARARIERAEQELRAGTAFSRVANRYSDCGGNPILGWVTRGTMVPEFEEVIFALQNGARSEIFRTIFGFHIATVLQRKLAEYSSLESMRPMLSRRMLEERRRHIIDMAMEEALRTASIEVASSNRPLV